MREEKTILIVDDNIDVITTYSVVLRRLGYKVSVAYDGKECIEKIKKEKPDMVLLDVFLPGLSGSEVCRLIKDESQTKDIPVVAITASMSNATRERMDQVGADCFLLKPIDVTDLSRVIKEFI